MYIEREIHDSVSGKVSKISTTLTFEELRQAHEAYDRIMKTQDIRSMCPELRENPDISMVVALFTNRLDNNDGYMESYWMVLEDTLAEFGYKFCDDAKDNEEDEEDTEDHLYVPDVPEVITIP